MNGSDEIIQYLLSSSQRENKNLILSKEEFISSPWVAFANDQLAPILYPNLCSTLSNSYRAFGYVHNVSDFSIPQRYLIQSLGSLAMYFAASKIKSYVPLFLPFWRAASIHGQQLILLLLFFPRFFFSFDFLFFYLNRKERYSK